MPTGKCALFMMARKNIAFETLRSVMMTCIVGSMSCRGEHGQIWHCNQRFDYAGYRRECRQYSLLSHDFLSMSLLGD